MYNATQIANLNADIQTEFPHLYPIKSEFKMHYEGISRMVMLDRYAQKDEVLKTLKVGDLVITIIRHDPNFPTRGIGYVRQKLADGNWLIEIEEQYVDLIDSAFIDAKLPHGWVRCSTSDLVKPLELFFEQIALRVGNFVGKDETATIRNDFVKELTNLNFVPAGRILYGAGSGKQVTYFNCYVMPFIHDSREGLARHREKVAEIMSRGGGVGTNGSTLRPKGAVAINVGGHSSGAVSWLNDLSALTHLIEQGGSRRGAQMIMMADWHPDIVEFIISKMQNPNNLLYLKKNLDSSLIQKEIDRKLSFKTLTPTQTMANKLILKNPDQFEKNFLIEARNKLRDNGEYEVVNPNFLTGANISIAISDAFIQAVEKDEMWDLKFPDNFNFTAEQKRYYEENWAEMGDIFAWEKQGLPTKVYSQIKARDLWYLINFCATYSAEPGIFFIERANNMSNAQGYGQRVVGTNPCGEQPLAPYSVCNLGAINLANFVDKKTGLVQFNKLKQTVKNAVRMQDNIIDLTPYFLPENKHQALGERRIGLGVMGLHDLLIWCGVRYGSEASNLLIDQIFQTISMTAYETSIELAKEKQSFPFLKNREKFVESGYLKTMPQHIRDNIIKYGIRNSHLLTVAPTGSTGTMVGGATGLEPYFAFSYFRSGRLGKNIKVQVPLVQEWLSYHPEFKDRELPDFFVSAMDLSPEAHATTQAIIQRWVDSSISKTVNAPRGFSVNQVADVYMYLYKHGAKGGTVYVDGSRDTQVLSLTDEENDLLTIDEENVPLEILIQEQQKAASPIALATEKPKIGYEAGNTCTICQMGILVEAGGCVTCNNCNAQIKCGL